MFNIFRPKTFSVIGNLNDIHPSQGINIDNITILRFFNAVKTQKHADTIKIIFCQPLIIIIVFCRHPDSHSIAVADVFFDI